MCAQYIVQCTSLTSKRKKLYLLIPCIKIEFLPEETCANNSGIKTSNKDDDDDDDEGLEGSLHTHYNENNTEISFKEAIQENNNHLKEVGNTKQVNAGSLAGLAIREKKIQKK